MTSITSDEHKVNHHTRNERCNSPYEICNDKSCIMYKKHMVCTAHPFHPGDRIINWEFRNMKGWVYYTKPNIINLNQVVYVKYDNDNAKIHARFGKCSCGDIFVDNEIPRNVTKSHIRNKLYNLFKYN